MRSNFFAAWSAFVGQSEEEARKAGKDTRLGLDWFAFVVSFKGVFLEETG